MNITFLGVSIGFFGCMLSGICGIFGGSHFWRKLSFYFFILSAFFGAGATLFFLVQNEASLVMSFSFLGEHFFSLDRLSAFFLFIVYSISFFSGIFASKYLEAEIKRYPSQSILPLTALFCLGMQGVLFSSTVLSFLLFWEAMSLSSFFLVMSDREKSSQDAALLYLSFTQLGAGALILGFGLLSGGQWGINFLEFTKNITLLSPTSLIVGTGLVFFAFASKAGIVPFHGWLPKAHPKAPSHISALMSGVMLNVALYGILRFIFDFLPELNVWWAGIFLILGIAGALFGVMNATIIRDIKRILAWSSVENMGLIFASIGFFILLQRNGFDALAQFVMAGIFFHILAHAFFKAGLFLGAGVVIHETHEKRIDSLGGLANRMKFFSVCMLGLIFAGAGLPPFGSFISEWALLETAVAGMQTGHLMVIIASILFFLSIAIVSGFAVFAMIRFFSFLFLAEPRSEGAKNAHAPNRWLVFPIAILGASVLFFGIFSSWLGNLFPVSFETSGLFFTHHILFQNTQLFPFVLAFVILITLGLAFGIKKLLSRTKERSYHTWNCGQPIDASMEYTGTAFSAPVRFFLKDFMHAEKKQFSAPVMDSNPWIRTSEISIHGPKGILRRIYFPLANLILFISSQAKRVQSGSLQLYIGLIFGALILTLFIAL